METKDFIQEQFIKAKAENPSVGDKVKQLIEEGIDQRTAMTIALSMSQRGQLKKSEETITSGINGDNPYIKAILPQLKGMKVNEGRHLELDNRFSIFLTKLPEDKYTGWVYWVNGNIPEMTFTSSTLPQIVRQGFEQGTFTNFGVEEHNRMKVETTIAPKSYGETEIKKDASEGPITPFQSSLTAETSSSGEVAPLDTSLDSSGYDMVSSKTGKEAKVKVFKSMVKDIIETNPEADKTMILNLIKSRLEYLVRVKEQN